MRVGLRHKIDEEDRILFRAYWPEAEEMFDCDGVCPIMEDCDMEADGDLPPHFLDKFMMLHFAAEWTVGLGHTPTAKCVIKPRRLENSGLAKEVSVEGGEAPENFFWQIYVEGRHFSVDVVFDDGKPIWSIWAEGMPAVEPHRFGQYVGWVVYPGMPPGLSETVGHITTQDIANRMGLQDFTGVMNLELIPYTATELIPIDIHMRPSLEFGPCYGSEARWRILMACMGRMGPLGQAAKRPRVKGGSISVIPRTHKTVRLPEMWRESLVFGEAPLRGEP